MSDGQSGGPTPKGGAEAGAARDQDEAFHVEALSGGRFSRIEALSGGKFSRAADALRSLRNPMRGIVLLASLLLLLALVLTLGRPLFPFSLSTPPVSSPTFRASAGACFE